MADPGAGHGGRAQRSLGAWAGYIACGWGLAFAAISFYWGLGGALGLDTLGGSLESLARAHDRTLFIAVWVTGFLKVLVALLGWVAAALLTLYGGTLIVPEALVAIGAIKPAQPVDWKPLVGTFTFGTCPSWSGAS